METNHQTKAASLKNTWLKHCDKSVFITNAYDKKLESLDKKLEVVVYNNSIDTYENLWQKTKFAFSLAFDHYYTINKRKGFDWFLKADDDTFILVENLKMYLKMKNENKNYYFGCKMNYKNKSIPNGYMSGGAGYVLSRGSLKKLVTEGFRNKIKCNKVLYGFEDAEMGSCLGKLNIFPSYINGRKDIIPFFPSKNLILYIFDISNNRTHDLLKKHLYDIPQKKGLQSLPRYPISLHYISPDNMYKLNYLFYKTKVNDSI
uniref:N-acetylgalactosaminide beta-1,3-galactosyltransferase n=1 Tax=Strongyloides papillosus TaxID=174720 RepID=A0A0N5C8Q3_STREA